MNSSTGKIFPDVSEISDEQSSTYNEVILSKIVWD